MGLFSSKKKTYVSSVAYPMGEDGDKRVDYLKYTVLNSVLQGRSVGESITQGYLRGQGISLRNAFTYARDRYKDGVPVSAARYYDQPDMDVLGSIIKAQHPGSTLNFLTTVVGSAQFEWYAEKYLTDQYGYDRTLKEFIRPPAGVEPTANVAYDLEPSGLIRILLMNQDGHTTVLDYRPEGFNRMANNVHSAYQHINSYELQNKTETRPATAGEVDTVSTTVTIIDRVGDRQEKTLKIVIDVEGDTATVTTVETVKITSRPQYFIYTLGSGKYPELDSWVQDVNLQAPYWPSIPVRVNNENYASPARKKTELYKTGKKLLKRVGVELDDVAESVNSNKDIKEIDFAFVTFGVALNTKSQEGKRYLYRYFEYLRSITSSTTTKSSWQQWESKFTSGQTTNAPEINSVQVYSKKDRANNHDIKIQWDYIDTKLKSGEVFPGAKPGDVSVQMAGTRKEFNFKVDMTIDSSKLIARKQIDENTYEELEISGLVHENFIYQGKSVTVTAYDAFFEKDEEGFIVPLNQQIVRDTPIVELTDLSYQVMHMVFNCYKVVKKKWYQSGWFKVLLVIVAIIVIVVSWGSATPAVVAGMSSAFAAAGVSVLLAKVLAATIYVLGMMVLSNILTPAFTEIFGEKWGGVILAIATIVAGNWGNWGNTFNAATAGNITASSVLRASTAVLNVYGAYTKGQMSGLASDFEDLQKQYDTAMEEVQKLTEANLGTNSGLIDIFGMIDSTMQQFESYDQFLSRTLITGSEVCEITNGLIENFAETGLRLPTTG